MGGPLSNEVVSFSSRGPFILYALLWGVGSGGGGTGAMICKQELNQKLSKRKREGGFYKNTCNIFQDICMVDMNQF